MKEDLSTPQWSVTLLTGLATITSFWGLPSSTIDSITMWVKSKTPINQGVMMRTFAALHVHSASRSPCQGRRTIQLRGHFLQCHDRGSNHASWNTNAASWGEPTSSVWWQFLAGVALESEVSRKIYRVTHHVVPRVMLTSRQKLCFSFRRICWNATFVMWSTTWWVTLCLHQNCLYLL